MSPFETVACIKYDRRKQYVEKDFRIKSNLPEHLVILNIVEFVGTNLSFQRILIKLPTDVHQQGSWT